jgi:transcription antitermination factor NusG
MNPTSKIEHPKSSIVLHPSSSIQESLGFRNWYAIYVKSRHEKSVRSELQQKGIESSLPLMTVTRQWSDRKKKVEVPLIRGYVFVKIDISKEKFGVLQTDGVVKFVTFCNKTVSIPEVQMFWLDQLFLSELNLTPETDFPAGTEVDVMFGPLKGLQGRVKQKNSKSRLVVWFDSIMQGVSVEIDPAFLSLSNSKKFELPLTIQQNKNINPVQTGEYIT